MANTQVKLFGGFSATYESQPIRFVTKPTETLVALLSTQLGQPLPRAQIASSIWPDVESAVGLNRLRTVIVYARQSLEPWAPLVADRTSLRLDLEGCDLDLQRAEALYRRARIAQNLDEEKEALLSLLDIVERDFLEGLFDEWTEPYRLIWRQRRLEASLRLSRIAFDAGEYELAARESESALNVDEFNEEAWAVYLRAMAVLGLERKAVDRFLGERKNRERVLDFSPELVDLARRVSAGQLGQTGVPRGTAAVRDLLGKVMETRLAEEPESLLPLLSGDSFKKHAYQYPREAWTLLHDVIERTSGTDPFRAEAMLTAMTLGDMADEFGTALDYGEWLIENMPEDTRVHRFAANWLGFISFELRDWTSAYKYLERFKELCELYGDQIEIAVAKAQKASLDWHRGDAEGAEKVYLEQVALLEHDSSPRGVFNQCVFLANVGGVSVTRFDWPTAVSRLGRAYSMAVANKIDYVRCCCLAPLGLAKIQTGSSSEGRRMVADGLTQTYRSRYRRLNQIAADYAIASLAVCGYRAEASAMLEAYTQQRIAAHHERSVIEERLADWARERIGGVEPSPAWMQLRHTELIAAASDLLEAQS